MTDTPRLALPLIEPGQAQKELFHNEALVRLDAAVQATVAAVGANAPPGTAPAPGTCYALGTAPTGAWAGQAGAIACWSEGGWRFIAAREGMAAWSADDGGVARFREGGWRRGGAIAEPAGGATVDAAARAAVQQILATLRLHGLIPVA